MKLVPDQIPQSQSSWVRALGEAVCAAGVMPEQEMLALFMSRLAKGKLAPATESMLGAEGGCRKRSIFQSAAKNVPPCPAIWFLETASGSPGKSQVEFAYVTEGCQCWQS